jgi:hypothetical protein
MEDMETCAGTWTFSIMTVVGDCPNVSGMWHFTNSGVVTYIIDGETETEYPSGSGTIVINQNGCAISWTEPVLNQSRSGTVSGQNVQVSGIFVVPMVDGVNITQNSYTASGTIAGDNNRMDSVAPA